MNRLNQPISSIKYFLVGLAILVVVMYVADTGFNTSFFQWLTM